MKYYKVQSDLFLTQDVQVYIETDDAGKTTLKIAYDDKDGTSYVMEPLGRVKTYLGRLYYEYYRTMATGEDLVFPMNAEEITAQEFYSLYHI